jgi:hypothetical protein
MRTIPVVGAVLLTFFTTSVAFAQIPAPPTTPSTNPTPSPSPKPKTGQQGSGTQIDTGTKPPPNTDGPKFPQPDKK